MSYLIISSSSNSIIYPISFPNCSSKRPRLLARWSYPNQCDSHDFLPRFPWQSGRDFCVLPERQRAINSSSVYPTDRYGVLLSFMIYAALSSGPRQWVPRPFEFIYRLYIPSFSSLHHFAAPPTSTSTSARSRYREAREKSSNSQEFIPPCVTGEILFLRPPPQHHRYWEMRSSQL